MAGGKTPLTFRLYKGDEFLREEKLALPVVKVGKLSSSHLRLEDKNVSRMHALIEVTGPGDVSIIDLLEVTNCGWFYCKRGLYARNGGAGAQIYTNCYFVNLTGASYSVYLIDMAMNAKFVACIMENGLITANGNITEPCSFVSCHIEACRITVPEARFDLRGGSGTTNGVTITLGQDTCHCHVEALGGGVYTYDHGHHNYVNGGYRYFECE